MCWIWCPRLGVPTFCWFYLGLWPQAQRQRELEVGGQRAQDDASQAYPDQMSHLLLDKQRPLGHSRQGDEVSTVARVRTLTVLSGLDGARKGNVVQFLYESHLITKGEVIVDLRGADLSEADLTEADLRWADLSDAWSWAAELLSAAYALDGATMPDGQILQDHAVPDMPTFTQWSKSQSRKEAAEHE
jgi:hypothetical protein